MMLLFSDWSRVFHVVPVKPITCAENEYACRNYMCVPEVQHCDGVDQCGDNSDEEHCKCCHLVSLGLISKATILISPSLLAFIYVFA